MIVSYIHRDNPAYQPIKDGPDDVRSQYLKHQDARVRAEAMRCIETPTEKQVIDGSRDSDPSVRFGAASKVMPSDVLVGWFDREQDSLVCQTLLLNNAFPGHLHPKLAVNALQKSDLTAPQLQQTIDRYKQKLKKYEGSFSTDVQMENILSHVASHSQCTEPMYEELLNICSGRVGNTILEGIAQGHNLSADTIKAFFVTCRSQTGQASIPNGCYAKILANPHIGQATWDNVLGQLGLRAAHVLKLRASDRVSWQGLLDGIDWLRGAGQSLEQGDAALAGLFAALTPDDILQATRAGRLVLNSPMSTSPQMTYTKSLGDYVMSINRDIYQQILGAELQTRIEATMQPLPPPFARERNAKMRL
ncbi:hypothetical protein D3C80_176380 [compost metagenome]